MTATCPGSGGGSGDLLSPLLPDGSPTTAASGRLRSHFPLGRSHLPRQRSTSTERSAAATGGSFTTGRTTLPATSRRTSPLLLSALGAPPDRPSAAPPTHCRLSSLLRSALGAPPARRCEGGPTHRGSSFLLPALGTWPACRSATKPPARGGPDALLLGLVSFALGELGLRQASLLLTSQGCFTTTVSKIFTEGGQGAPSPTDDGAAADTRVPILAWGCCCGSIESFSVLIFLRANNAETL